MRPELVRHFSLELNPSSATPLPLQITQQIRALVTAGTLQPGDHLPSTRALAQRLKVSRGTVVAAYEQLAGEGLLYSAHGSGTRIHPELTISTPSPPLSPPAPQRSPQLIDCAPGQPDTTKLIDPSWRAAWRVAATKPLETPDILGSLHLRTEIAEHIRAVRGFVVDPAHIMVTAGAREGLQIAIATLQHFHEARSIGVESPGYPSLRRLPPFFGMRTVDIPTDGTGLDLQALAPEQVPDAVLLTPQHQYPFGGSLSAGSRTATLRWAREHNVWLIEDDFSSELRYEGMPLPTLCATARDRCLLLGTFSSVLTPSVACGYLVLPPQLLGEFREIRAIFGQPVSALTQEALAVYLEQGALRRHIQKTRRLYMRRRDIVSQAFADVPGAQLMPIESGLHAVVLCEMPASIVVARCFAAGIRMMALEDYWGGSGCPNGVVFGFGAHPDATLQQVVGTLRHALAGEAPSSM